LPSARKPRQRKISVSDLPKIEHTLISKIDLYQPQKETIIRTSTDIENLRLDLEFVYERYAALKSTYRRKIASLRKLIKKRSDEYDQAYWEVKCHVQENTIDGIDEDRRSSESQPSTTTDAQAPWHEAEDLEQQVTCPSTTNDQLQPQQIAERETITDKLKKMNVGVRKQPDRTANQESESVRKFQSVPRSHWNHINRQIKVSDRRNIVCYKCKKKGHIMRQCCSTPEQEAK
jgi:Zinc knuckle